MVGKEEEDDTVVVSCLSLHAIMRPSMLSLPTNFAANCHPLLLLLPPLQLPLLPGRHHRHCHHRGLTHHRTLQRKRQQHHNQSPAYQLQHHRKNINKFRQLGLIQLIYSI
jgi:hypothetical protein